MSHPSLRPLTVLVADDDTMVTFLLARLFRERGHAVHAVGDASGAEELDEGLVFDAALVDVNMPGGGRAVVESLVRRGSLKGPVLVMTGDRDADFGPDLPITEVVRKPFRFGELVERVERLAAEGREERGAAERGGQNEGPARSAGPN